jgi:SAM-dependent methyltransferase
MERSEYDKPHCLEDRMWWFAACHRNLLILSRRGLPIEARAGRILDAGCGTGGFLAGLAACYANHALFGIELDSVACERAAAKSGQPVCAGSINKLPFPDGAFAMVFSNDVLCHRDVDECRALAQFHRCLAENGRLVVNLPAYRWMCSRHDTAVHNVRRYTVQRLGRLLNAAGFHVIYSTYWNAVLFPLMVISRKFLSKWGGATSDVALYPRPIDTVCRAATHFETFLLRGGLRLPFGGSVLAIATKGGSVGG